jgi:hypothetical protein
MYLSLLLMMLAAQDAVPAAQAPATQKPQLVCRESEHQTGSHIRVGRQCKTAEEWRQEDEARQVMPPSARITIGQSDPLKREHPQN